MTITDYAKAHVRTVVPFIVAWLLTFALRHGVDLHGYQAAVTVVVGSVYYAVARLLERYVTPKFGWLLGIASQPVYAKPKKPAPLPAPSGRKLGHLPSPRDDRDYLYQPSTEAKALPIVHHAAELTFDALGNLQVGDCAEAGEEHARQVIAHIAGKTYTPTTAQTIGYYSAITGYRPGQASTDRGTVLRDMLAWLVEQGIITKYQAVPTDAASLHAAIVDHGAVLCGFALPAGAEAEGVKWRVPRTGKAAGSWGGHCVPLVGASASLFDLVSWGELGTVSHGFVTDYIDEAWTVTYADTALGA